MTVQADEETNGLALAPKEYSRAEFDPPAGEVCDLIMKGGITSGVVYPHTICEVATKYRLRSIGGTSAGAIAAALAAAAEFHRASAQPSASNDAGYLGLSRLPRFLASDGNLFKLFQPQEDLKAHFNVGLGVMKAFKTAGKWKIALALWRLVRHFPRPFLVAAVIALAPVAVALPFAHASLPLLATAMLAVLGCVVAVSLGLVSAVLWAGLTGARRLPRSRFGLCSGYRASDPTADAPAPLTEWLHGQIQTLAGRPGGAPLTFGELADAQVQLSVMTTDLSRRRPFELSLNYEAERAGADHFRGYYYKPSELAELFPLEVVDALSDASRRETSDGDFHDGDALLRWPAMRDVPIIVATRLSLSFPLLLQAVPLYRKDPTLRDEKARMGFRRCWLSDGGISSNLPIHFFDSALPSRPTFAIALEPHADERHGTTLDGRVAMFTGGEVDPADKETGLDPLNRQSRHSGIAIEKIDSLFGFFSGILNAAKDWQDVMQSAQAGYRDRIVHVALRSGREGGLNLDMGEKDVNRMINLGARAGRRLLRFEFDNHRWRRFMSITDMVERELDHVHDRWGTPAGADGRTFREFLADQAPREPYFPPPDPQTDPAWLGDAFSLYEGLSNLAVSDSTAQVSQRGRTPLPRTDLKARPRL